MILIKKSGKTQAKWHIPANQAQAKNQNALMLCGRRLALRSILILDIDNPSTDWMCKSCQNIHSESEAK